MAGPENDLSEQALRARNRIDHFIESGHMIRALVELRALLEAERFWSNPDRDSPIRTTYLKSIDRFAAHGVSEAELNISLRA